MPPPPCTHRSKRKMVLTVETAARQTNRHKRDSKNRPATLNVQACWETALLRNSERRHNLSLPLTNQFFCRFNQIKVNEYPNYTSYKHPTVLSAAPAVQFRKDLGLYWVFFFGCCVAINHIKDAPSASFTWKLFQSLFSRQKSCFIPFAVAEETCRCL